MASTKPAGSFSAIRPADENDICRSSRWIRNNFGSRLMFRVDERDFSDARPRTGFAWVASLASQVAPTDVSDKLTNVRLSFTVPSRLFLAPLMALLDAFKTGAYEPRKGDPPGKSHLQTALRAAPRRTRISAGLR